MSKVKLEWLTPYQFSSPLEVIVYEYLFFYLDAIQTSKVKVEWLTLYQFALEVLVYLYIYMNTFLFRAIQTS